MNVNILKSLKKYSCPLTASGLLILFFHQFLFSDKTFYFRDIHRWFYPMKYFLASSFRDGSLPFWCPNYFCGSPFLSDIQSGVFYPLSALFLIEPFYRAFNYYIIVHLFIGFCFFYLFIRETGLTRKAALISSVSYCFGGYTLSSINTLNNLTTAVWLPAILWSFTYAVKKRNKSGYFLCAIFLAMSVLGGEPQLFIMSAGLFFLYGVSHFSHKDSFKDFLKMPLLILLLLTAATALTVVQTGPLFSDYRLSIRAGGIPYSEALKHSLDFSMLKHLIIPLRFPPDFVFNRNITETLFPEQGNIPWLLTVYPGMAILPLALLSIFSNFSKKKLIFWLIIFFSGLIFALGKNTPAYHLIFLCLPVFRFPEKFVFLSNFALMVIAAYGIQVLADSVKKINKKYYLIIPCLFVILTGDLYFSHKYLNPPVNASSYNSNHELLKPVLEDSDIFRVYIDPEINNTASSNDSIFDHHFRWQKFLMPNIGTIRGISHAGGVTGLEMRYQYLITEILNAPWKEKIQFLKLTNTRYIVSLKNLTEIPVLKDQVEKVNDLIYKIRNPLPRSWIAGNLENFKTGTVEELINNSFNPYLTAITKGDITEKYNKPYFNNVDKISFPTGSHIHIETKISRPGILVLSESSYPGWEVYVNGEKRDCLWLDLLFQGVELEQGEHKIDFIFYPKNFICYSVISLFSISLLVFIWLYILFRAKRKQYSGLIS